MTEHAPNIRDRVNPPVAGLGFVTGVVVLPHFDRMEHWLPGATEAAIASAPPGYWVLGIDEDTAVVGDGTHWEVRGRGTVTVQPAGADPFVVGTGDYFDLELRP